MKLFLQLMIVFGFFQSVWSASSEGIEIVDYDRGKVTELLLQVFNGNTEYIRRIRRCSFDPEGDMKRYTVSQLITLLGQQCPEFVEEIRRWRQEGYQLCKACIPDRFFTDAFEYYMHCMHHNAFMVCQCDGVEILSCRACLKDFDDIEEASLHIAFDHEGREVCDTCKTSFENEKEFHTHETFCKKESH